MRRKEIIHMNRQHIVIIGGGFAGLNLAKNSTNKNSTLQLSTSTTTIVSRRSSIKSLLPA